MRQVVEGKVYDTGKAELLHGWENFADTGDFEYQEESLYRTAKGAYFVAGSGGPMSDYATPLGGNSRGGGAGIRVVSEHEAVGWLEDHGGTEALIEHFSEALEEA